MLVHNYVLFSGNFIVKFSRTNRTKPTAAGQTENNQIKINFSKQRNKIFEKLLPKNIPGKFPISCIGN